MYCIFYNRMTLPKDKEQMDKLSDGWNWGCYLEKEKATAAPVVIFKHVGFIFITY